MPINNDAVPATAHNKLSAFLSFLFFSAIFNSYARAKISALALIFLYLHEWKFFQGIELCLIPTPAPGIEPGSPEGLARLLPNDFQGRLLRGNRKVSCLLAP